MIPKRAYSLNQKAIGKGPIIYWMSREQRTNDNWGLLHAQKIALKNHSELYVVFCLLPDYLGATFRQYDFMLKGLEIVQDNLMKNNIPFVLLTGNPEKEIPAFAQRKKAGCIICDFDPLKNKRIWTMNISKKISCAMIEIDSHNIVPCRIASEKQEYGAYTIRPKINKLLPGFLDDYPKLKKMNQKTFANDFAKAAEKLIVNTDVRPVDWIKPGENNALTSLREFIRKRAEKYNELRNDPNMQQQSVSMLSPYLHFGQISAQIIAIEIIGSNITDSAKEAFLEQLIIRKELADNFCFYNKDYDNINGMPQWAKDNHDKHSKDPRDYNYNIQKLEQAKTHDTLWNAAQKQMTKTGYMHNYMRMYWAKKILEWTKSPQEAIHIAIYLNDKYELDGRDPNGYVGVLWSIGGLHDRPWIERPVFGKIRYMNYNGCKRKFDVNQYINRYSD